MSVRAYTAELHDKVLAGFASRRGHKWRGQISEVARETGCTRRTVLQAWETGWPERDLPPIKDLLAHENVNRRAMAQQLVETAQARKAAENLVAGAQVKVDGLKAQAAKLERGLQEVAQFDADEMAKREVKMVRGLSALVLNGISYAGQTFTPEMIAKLASTIRERVLAGTIDSKEARAFFFTLGQFVERLAHAGEVCMNMERQRLGDPNLTMRVEVVTGTPEELREEGRRTVALMDTVIEVTSELVANVPDA
jgi:hypothetical protein